MKQVKTSQTHPILIDFINQSWNNSQARLGITFAPGKIQPDALTGSWQRNLSMDLNRIKQVYKIQTLVCLLENIELQKLFIPNQIQECVKYNIKPYHFPIKDGGIPKNQTEFKKLVKQIVDNHLRKGSNVVVHCMGGLGRAPTFAAACLIYSGIQCQQAIKMIRLARKNTLSEFDQLQFLGKLKFD